MSTMASIKEAKGALREATVKKLTNVSAEERKIQSEIVKEKVSIENVTFRIHFLTK